MGIDPLSLGITIALNVASAALQASRHIEGPRLTDLSATVADYGTPIATALGLVRLELPAFFLEPIKERKHKRKTKGGKYNEYTYFGTGGYVVADHELSQYRRLWLDRHLVYDAVGGADLFAVNDNYELTHYVRFYYGTADQDVDPRMQAFIEAQDGPDSCPAFLRVAYVFFEDLPLEKIGNRYPQVSAEIIGLTKPMIAELLAA